MTEYRIEREVVIEAPVEVVWHTITEPDQIAQWFADRVDLEAKPGNRGTVAFDYPEGESHTAALVVEAVEPLSLFSFRWGHPEGQEPEAGNSLLVEFRLAQEGDERTRLRVLERGLDLLDWPDGDKRRYAEEHGSGWGTFLDRLRRLFAS